MEEVLIGVGYFVLGLVAVVVLCVTVLVVSVAWRRARLHNVLQCKEWNVAGDLMRAGIPASWLTRIVMVSLFDDGELEIRLCCGRILRRRGRSDSPRQRLEERELAEAMAWDLRGEFRLVAGGRQKGRRISSVVPFFMARAEPVWG